MTGDHFRFVAVFLICAVLGSVAVGQGGAGQGANGPIRSDSQIPAAPNWVWVSHGAGGGGAFFAPCFNPRNSSDMWVTSDMNPVLHTTNLSAPDRKWICIDWSQYTGGRSGYVRFTSDPSILYGLDGLKGPIKSVDGGTTWKKLSGWATDQTRQAFNVFADPDSIARVLVAGKDDVFLSTDGGDSFVSLYSSPGVFVAGILFDPADKTIYLGSSKGLLKSSNNGKFEMVDAALPQSESMIAFTGAKDAKGTIRLMCVTGARAAAPGVEIEARTRGYKGIYSLEIGQKQWTARTEGIPADHKIGHIAMANGNINAIYGAGTGGGSPTVYKIADASSRWKWQQVFQNSETGFAANNNIFTAWEGNGGDRGWGFDEIALGFTVDPGDVSFAAVTGDGFLHYTSDGGATWHQAYVSPGDENPAGQATPVSKAYHNVGLNDTAVHWLAWADRDTIFAGYTDIEAARSTDGGKTWAVPPMKNLLNTQYVVQVAPNGSLYAASCAQHDIYQTWAKGNDGGGTGNIIVSSDKGATWTIIQKFGNPVVWIELDGKDPTGNTMYASILNGRINEKTANVKNGVVPGGIYKTTDLGKGPDATWTRLASPPRTEGHPYNIRLLKDGSIVTTYGDRFVNNKFTPSSGVFYSSDGGKTWADRSDPKMQYYTRGLTIDPTDPGENTWYAATRNAWGGVGEHCGGLFKTTDRGQTWKMVCDCTFEGAESCTINPVTKEIFLATESHGLMYAPDTTAKELTFVPTNYPYSHPYRIFINPYDAGDIWICSYGYGIAEGRVAPPSR